MCDLVKMPPKEQQAKVNAARPKVEPGMQAGTKRQAGRQAGRQPAYGLCLKAHE